MLPKKSNLLQSIRMTKEVLSPPPTTVQCDFRHPEASIEKQLFNHHFFFSGGLKITV